MSRTRTMNNVSAVSSGAYRYGYSAYNPNNFSVRMDTTPGFFITIPAMGTVTNNFGLAYSLDQKTGTEGTITDELSPPRQRSYNEVIHTKTEYQYAPQGGQRVDILVPTYGGSGPTPHLPAQVSTWWSTGANDGFPTSPTGSIALDSVTLLRSYCEDNLNLGELPPVLDLPLFIGELQDFKGLYEHTLRGLLDLLTERPRLFRLIDGTSSFSKLVRGSRGSTTPLKVVDAALGGHLSWKLALEPFINGVNAMRPALDHLARTHARAMSPKPVIRRAHYSDTGTASDAPVNSAHTRVTRRKAAQRTVSVWAQVQRTPVSISAMQSVQATYLLSVRPQVAWELVPLTFVVDWFIDVGKWLSQFDGSILNLPYEVVQSGYSVKDVTTYMRDLEIFVYNGNPYVGMQDPALVTGSHVVTDYRRYRAPLLDAGSALQPIQIGLPNFNQLGTLVELLFLKMRAVYNRNV